MSRVAWARRSSPGTSIPTTSGRPGIRAGSRARIRGDRAVADRRRGPELGALGTRIERHFGAPQDIEFAVDRAGTVWIVQSRRDHDALPAAAGLPDPDTDLRVLFSFNVAQGYFPPITPLGLEVYRLLGERVVETIAAAPVRRLDAIAC